MVFSNWFPSFFFCDLKRLLRDPIPTAAQLGQAEPPSGSHTSATIPEKVVFNRRGSAAAGVSSGAHQGIGSHFDRL